MDSQLFADSQAPDFTLVVNNTDFVCSLPLLTKKSLFLKAYIRENPNSDNYETEVDDPKNICNDYLSNIFMNDQQFEITSDNFEFLNNLDKKLRIPDLKRLIAAYQYQIDVSNKQIDQNPEILSLHQIEDIFINLNSENYESSIESASSISTSLTELIMARTALAACISRPMSIELILSFIIQYDKQNETDFISHFINLCIHEFNKIIIKNDFNNNSNQFNRFQTFQLNNEPTSNKTQNNRNQQEIYFIIAKLINKKLVDPNSLLINSVRPSLLELVNNKVNENIIEKKNSFNIVDHCPLNFVHLLTEAQLSEKIEKLNPRSVFYQNLFTLQDNEWNMHKKLLDDGINPDEIAAAIRNDDIETFNPMISSRPAFYVDNEIEESVYERCSPLCKATCFIELCAFYGSIKCFNFLIEKNAQITPNLMKMAVMGGNLDIVKKCNEMGCRFDQTILCSIKYHRQNILEYLINEINIKYWNIPEVIKYCLMYANFNAFTFLIEKGGNSSDYLIEACHYGNVLAVKWLLDITGTEVTSESISYGCKSGDPQIVDSLLLQEKNIDLNKPSFITSASATTAVKPTRGRGRGKKTADAATPISSILNQNINGQKSLKDEGFTPLHYACYSNSVEIVESLLKKSGIDVNVKTRENKTPLHISCEYGYDKIAELLLNRKSINVNIKTIENMLPLHYACKSGNAELVGLILKQKKVRSNTKITKGVFFFF